MATPHLDDLASLAAFTSSGLSVSAGDLTATAGGVAGLAYRPFGDATTPLTAVARIVPDKSDTAGRWALVGQACDATGPSGAGYGSGVNYKAGTGFRVGLVSSNAPHEANQTLLLADAAVIDDSPYYVALSANPQSSVLHTTARLYDFAGRLVGSGMIDSVTQTWHLPHRFILAANSAASKIGRVCCDSNIFGEALTIPNRVVDVVGTRLYANDINQIYGIYAPGAGHNSKILAVQLHGAGTWSADEGMGGTGLTFAMTNPSNAWIDAMLRSNVPTVTPSQYSATAAGTNSFGSPDAYTLTVLQIQEALSYLDPDTKVVLIGQSMGCLMALRLVTGGAIPNIVAVCLYDPLTSLSLAYTDPANGTFATNMDASWGAAIGTRGTYDAHALLASTPSLFRGIAWYVSYCADDLVVYPTRYAIPFTQALSAAAIPYTLRTRSYGGHVSLTKLIATSDAAEFAGIAVSAARRRRLGSLAGG